jgi:hypothetical protein
MGRECSTYWKRSVIHGVLRGIFGPERDEVTGEWSKLHNEELNDLYCSPNIVRVITSSVQKTAYRSFHLIQNLS